ncbi:TPA: hypothetical protein MW242_002654 [Acinetobacter baumannii]|nr:hypothetical protein [Acinetobacter baumannii]
MNLNQHDITIESPWILLGRKQPPITGEEFIVWDEVLEKEVLLAWFEQIKDFGSKEQEWSGSFTFWRENDDNSHDSPYFYQKEKILVGSQVIVAGDDADEYTQYTVLEINHPNAKLEGIEGNVLISRLTVVD